MRPGDEATPMNWLRNYLISTDAHNMAYKQPSSNRFVIILAVTLVCLAIAIVLGQQGII